MAFYKVAELNDLKGDGKKCANAGGRQIALVRMDGGYHAVDNRCPHRQGQLCDGSVKQDKGEIVCPLHGWNFDLKTGVSPYDPKDRVKTFNVEERTDGIYVEVKENEAAPPLTGYLDPWRRRIDDREKEMEMIHHMADGWIGKHGYTEPMRTEKQPSLLDRIVFLPRQLASPPLLDDEPVELKTVVGRSARKPITISMPVYVSHMSFGALSREAKMALAEGSKMAGTMICSGEGGMLPEERERASVYILEMASGYFGWTDEAIAKSDGVEIKIGQAAKAGMGGMLPGKKVTDEIAKVRGLKKGRDAISPSRFKDISSVSEMKKRVAEIKKITGGKPVGIKMAAGRLEEDLAAALECEPDFITIDGRGGATGAAPKHVKDNICIPTLYALDRARRFFENRGVKMDIMVTGGFRLPSDFAKAIALGATAVACATASMIAIGCQQYLACHTGRCPVGIATQDPELRKRLDVGISAKKLANFFEAAKYQLTDFARICGRKNVHDLSLADIATTSDEIARYTAIPHVGQPI
jgi:glutamate synthase domain-containing protein 2